MGNACSCLTGLDQNDHHAVRYGDVPKYGGPCERLQQVPVSMSALEQKNSGSPRKGREVLTLAIDQSDTQQLDEQGSQQQPQHWHSPTAAERQQQHQHQQYLQSGTGAVSGLDAAADEHEEEQEVPTVPFSWTKGELIGIGAFGRVYTALNNETGELVAVKQVSFAKDEALQGRVAEHIRALEAEVDVLKNLKHENIVRYLGTERTGDALHIFLEYVPGGSIASLLTRFGAFPEAVIRAYTAQLLRGLEYLHARGIMHRDIKGANILIDKHGTVKLADFGASKKIEDLATVGSGSTSIRGTPYWMAPEVIKQTGHGRPADIWSLACTVIEMATGKPPWSNLYSQPVSAMFHIASSKDPPKLPDHLSPEAKDFLMLCFNRVARDRANATRLLKHPFVTKAQLPQPLPFPGSNTANNGSPAGQRAANGQGRSHLSSVAVGGSTPQQSRDGRQAHTPPGPRHSTGMQPAFASSGSSSLRPSAVSGAALAASNKARCSPPSNAHGSPRRQQQQHQVFSEQAGTNASPGSACSGLSSQRGDASAIVTTMRPQQQTPGKQQQDEAAAGPLQKQQQQLQQQQQGRQSPRPFEQQQAPQQQQQQQQQPQQQQGRRSITPRSAAEAAAAAAAAAAGGGGHDTGCMTLVDWNPMVEPSWMPGSYQVPGTGAKRDKAAGREQQTQQYGPGGSNGSRQQPGPAAEAADVHAPNRQQQGGQQGAPGSTAMGAAAAGAASAAHMKRGSTVGNPGSSILSAPGGSTRSNGGIGSRKLEGTGSGPLASGPVGRASRENLFGLGAGGGAAAAATAAVGASSGAAAGSNGGRLGSSRGWGSGLTAAAGAGPSSQQAAAGSGSASGGSPPRSTSAASGSGFDADGCEESMPVPRTNSSSTGTGSGPLLQQAEGQRLSSSGSYGRTSSQQGVSESAMAQLSSKHAQWEQELFEELARQREEHRASRAAGQSSRRSGLQQQQSLFGT